jgi:hypothetical protein
MTEEQVRAACIRGDAEVLGAELLRARTALREVMDRADWLNRGIKEHQIVAKEMTLENARLLRERDELLARLEATKMELAQFAIARDAAAYDFEEISKALATYAPLPAPRSAGGIVIVTTLKEKEGQINSLVEEIGAAKRLAAKDTQLVKALADALEAAKVAMWRGEFGSKGRDKNAPTQIDDALRLAGRLS